VNLRNRLERLEKAIAQHGFAHPPPELAPAMSDEQLAETTERFLNGESWEAIARSQGRPWNPPTHRDHAALSQVTDDDLRVGIHRLLTVAVDATADETSAKDADQQAADRGFELYDAD